MLGIQLLAVTRPHRGVIAIVGQAVKHLRVLRLKAYRLEKVLPNPVARLKAVLQLLNQAAQNLRAFATVIRLALLVIMDMHRIFTVTRLLLAL